MTMEITIQVPDALGQQLQPFRERLPEVLERGLRDLLTESTDEFGDETAIIELLVSQPTPERVLSAKPSPEFQARVSELLLGSKQGTLSQQEEAELDRYLTLEHLMRLAKSYAYRQLKGVSGANTDR